MIYALEKHDFELARPFVQETVLANAAAAVVDGLCPGQVWVDDPAVPSVALVDSPEGYYVLGSPPDASFPQALADFIMAAISPGGPCADWWWFYLRCGSAEWAEALKKRLPAERTAEEPREFYLCERVTFDWRGQLPAGFELLRVDSPLLKDQDLNNLDRVRRWARSNFGSVERFLEHGFAFCIRHADEIVSWCVTDCVSPPGCEVGVHTDERFRRQGLGAVVVAAAVEWALNNGYERVGWHNHAFNIASATVARKVGFVKGTDYLAFKICTKPIDASLLKGTAALIEHRFQAAADHYGRAFQAAGVSPETPASNLLRSRDDKARYALLSSCASSLAGKTAAGASLLDQAIDLAGLRQGGY